jgi:hypothetical protein
MTYEDYKRFGERFLESEVVDGYSGQPLNVVDGLFAIAKSISDLEDTLGRMPLKNMAEDTVEALNNVAGAIADHGNH